MTEERSSEATPAELLLLRDAMRGVQAPEELERTLASEFRQRQRVRRPRFEWWRLLATGAAAAIIVLAVLVLQPAPPEPAAAAAEEFATDYMPVGYGRPIDPGEFLQVVRVSMPRSEMAQFGLPMPAEPEPGRVMADVVFGEDGVARAIRFVE